ncbi:ATP-binding cassette domain-containing protein, partial [Frankia sp. Cpl3]|nr:ATP-binding cassette domain-containing protein [Frankia sp. Cpl3]
DQVSFQVAAGEIVGIAGVSGNGQSELIQAITGLLPVDQGNVTLQGTDVTNAAAKKIRETGLAHIPEDRYLWGAAKEATVKENSMMVHYRKGTYRKSGLLRHQALNQMVQG